MATSVEYRYVIVVLVSDAAIYWPHSRSMLAHGGADLLRDMANRLDVPEAQEFIIRLIDVVMDAANHRVQAQTVRGFMLPWAQVNKHYAVGMVEFFAYWGRVSPNLMCDEGYAAMLDAIALLIHKYEYERFRTDFTHISWIRSIDGTRPLTNDELRSLCDYCFDAADITKDASYFGRGLALASEQTRAKRLAEVEHLPASFRQRALTRMREDMQALDAWRKRLDAKQRLEAMRKRVALSESAWSSIRDGLMPFLMGEPAAARAILLYGPPGTGKTTVAKAIAETAGIGFTAISVPDLKMPSIGASGQRVRAVWDEAAKQPRSVIFIDECDAIFAKRGGLTADTMTNEIVAAILPRIDGMERKANILLICATNNHESLDPAIRSRFDLQIRLDLPDADTRLRILRDASLAYKCPLAITASEADATEGMSGRDLDTLIRTVTQRTYSGAKPDLEFHTCISAWRTASGSTVDRTLTWDDVVLQPATAERLRRFADMLGRRTELAKVGLDVVPRGLLLTGPPGTGKTQIARVFASVAKTGFIAASLPDLKGGFVGHTGQRVRDVFDRARAVTPSVIFLDEVDTIAPARGTGDSFSQDLIGQLLQEIDGVLARDGLITIIAATNSPEAIDPAVRSRLGEAIEIPLPQREQRVGIIKRLLAGRRIAEPIDDVAGYVANRTSGASGRDLRSLVERAIRMAAHRYMDSNDLARGAICAADFDTPDHLANKPLSVLMP